MKCIIHGKEYSYVSNLMTVRETREKYFSLTKKVFGLDFNPWYESGYYSNSFIPYGLLDKDNVAASVGICINDMKWENEIIHCIQISTVMTDPEYRKNGLNRWLLETIIAEWKDKCDLLYLYANDSVIDFYPRFGFKVEAEWQYYKPVMHKNSIVRKLDVTSSHDRKIIIEKYQLSNPYSALSIENNLGIVMFHCVTFMKDDIYYIEEYNAVVIAKYNNERLICYDIFTDIDNRFDEIVGALVRKDTEYIQLGFTPKAYTDYKVNEVIEKDTTFFILKDKENIFSNNQVMFPLLSHA